MIAVYVRAQSIKYCRAFHARCIAHAPSLSEGHARAALFATGCAILAVGLTAPAEATPGVVNQEKIQQAFNVVMSYLEGTFGALVMACAGIGAITSAAFGQYRASLSLMVVAIGAFILRSLIHTFFIVDDPQ